MTAVATGQETELVGEESAQLRRALSEMRQGHVIEKRKFG